MTKKLTRVEELDQACRQAGCYVRTYSPGDGVTRYRFFTIKDGEKESTYFGPKNGDYTALGFKEALAYARGRGAYI